MRQYIRVECVNEKTNESIGGYFAVLMMLLSKRAGVSPDVGIDEMIEKIQITNTQDMQNLLIALMELGDLPQPEIYKSDTENYVCLYEVHEFYEAMYCLDVLREMLEKDNSNFTIKTKDFYLEDDEITYFDGYQIVISKETYKKHFSEQDYFYLPLKILETEILYEEALEDFEEDE